MVEETKMKMIGWLGIDPITGKEFKIIDTDEVKVFDNTVYDRKNGNILGKIEGRIIVTIGIIAVNTEDQDVWYCPDKIKDFDGAIVDPENNDVVAEIEDYLE
jgi:hypothetical protein